MKTIVCIFIVCFVMTSCSKGVWLSQYAYRPKKPAFSILKDGFTGNGLINNNFLYTSTRRSINYDGNTLAGYMGFYKDGKMIVDNTSLNELEATLTSRNSLQTASVIGYYTSSGNNIKVEYFIQGDGGHYENRQGIIKADTIIFSETVTLLFKKETRRDTLVRSSYQLH